jgi:peptidoglycan/xylan/chitin deacetylase (PgdA/CDA1 family)
MTFVRGNRGPRTTQQPPGFGFQHFSLSALHLLLLAAFSFQLFSLSVFQTMRLDRFITLNLVRPFHRLAGRVRSINHQPSTLNPKWSVPILMYHSISDDPEPGVPPYYKTNTSPAVFRQHMQFLADHGYRTISLDELVEKLRTAHHASFSNSQLSTPNHQLVAITFDDGFRDFYTEAFPVLKQHGFTATMFLPTAFIRDSRPAQGSRFDGSGFKAPCHFPFRNPRCEFLTWPEIRELRQAGIEFGSHTVTHPKLVELDWPETKSELSDSKSEIEQRLGEPATAFCYPFAFPQTDRAFAQKFRELLCETGYSSCATTELGRVHPGTDPFRLKRLPANSLDNLALFAAKLDGAYDWLAKPQSAVKRFKALLMAKPTRKSPISLPAARPNPAS